jgi:GNAT superfamily N-acetyltransferase
VDLVSALVPTHTIFDELVAQYAVARRRLDGRTAVYTVHAGQQLELVARAVLDVTKGSVSDVLVWPAWRRRGIATALYRLIEWETGKPLQPSRVRSAAGRKFWASRRRHG